MLRRKNVLLVGLIVLILVGVSGVLLLLVRHEPGFYRRSGVAAGPQRKELSTTFVGQLTRLISNFKDPESQELRCTFSEAQINSYLAEDFMRLGDGENLEKHGVTEPRVSIEKDRLRVAFRHTSSLTSTVFSVDTRIWLVPNETNVIAVEILSHKIGAMPLFLQSLRDDFDRMAASRNIEVSWYRHEGHPVALLRVHSSKNQTRPSTKFQRLHLTEEGTLSIDLVSTDPMPTAQSQKALAPVGN